jgi:hypothetical protein
MKKKIGVLICVGILFFVCQLQAMQDATWTEGHQNIHIGDDYVHVYLYNDSSLDMWGGSIFRLEPFDTSTVNLHSGEVVELYIYNGSSSTVTVLGGTITTLRASNTATINFYDGLITNGLALWDDTVVNIYGGRLNGISASDNSIINLYAYDVALDTETNFLSGYYLYNDEYFSFYVPPGDSYSHINIIPEPVTLMLMALGSLVLKKKFREEEK